MLCSTNLHQMKRDHRKGVVGTLASVQGLNLSTTNLYQIMSLRRKPDLGPRRKYLL